MKIFWFREYQKTAALAAGMILFLLGLLIFIDWPRQRELSRLRMEFQNVQANIQMTEQIISQGRSMDEEITALLVRSRWIEGKFPSGEEGSLGRLSELARQNNVEIVSMRFEPKRPLLTAEHSQIEVGGKVCQSVLVSLELKSNFKNFVAYLEALKEFLPAYLTVERMEIRKGSVPEKILNVSLKVNLYLLS